MLNTPLRTPLRTPMRRLLALGVAGTVIVAACGGDGESASTTDPPRTTEATSTTAGTSTTEATTSTTAAETTTTAAPIVAPLTGLPALDSAVAARPAMAVKLDNHPDARPHAGLNQADIVYEEIVEGITRFFAIFQSTDAAPIGPIRSARTTDVDLLNQLNRPLFVWSGGNGNVVRAIGGANAESRAYGQGPGFYRDSARRRRTDTEHTLMNEGTATLYQTLAEGQGPPPPFFAYRAAGTPAAGTVAATSIDARMNSVPVNWAWDPLQALWIRSEYNAPHVDQDGVPISASNVVVQFVPYRTSSADRRSPEAVTVGEGDAWIFTDGQLVLARWSRPDQGAPAVFTDGNGQSVPLTPGRTWIELAQAGDTQVSFA